MPLLIDVRPALNEDCRDLWTWRNDAQTRSMSISTEEVSWSAHEAWFHDVQADPARTILIGLLGGEKIGMCRFDEHAGPPARMEVSINLNPGFRGRRLAVPLLHSAISTFRLKRAGEIVAQVRDENVASIRTFERAGFWLAWRLEGLRFYRYADPTPLPVGKKLASYEIAQ